MSTNTTPADTIDEKSWRDRPGAAHVAWKVWREIKRPFRPLIEPAALQEQPLELPAAPAVSIEESPVEPTQPAPPPYLTGSGADIAGFHPQQATVEPEGIDFVTRLVRESRQYSGPIIEIGTLLGVTTTNMALAKAPHQKIITVDLYCWNPWGLSPDAHEALTDQALYYLIKTGHVERVRMDKNDFYAAYEGPPPAMVFLDAWHDYDQTKIDIEWARRAGARIISGHDYCEEFPGVKQAVDEFGGPRELAASVWLL
jgi:Methyltransferase domain